MAGGFEGKATQAGLALLAARSGEVVLEIGCGTGNSVRALAKAAETTGKIYAVDIAEKMLAVTRRKIEKAGLGNRVELVRGEGEDLPFADGLADAVFMSFILELFDTPDIPVVLKECRRILKPEGRICVVGLSKEGGQSPMTRLYEWAHRLMPNLVDCRPIYVRRSLEEAGFNVTETSFLSMAGLTVEVVLAGKPWPKNRKGM